MNICQNLVSAAKLFPEREALVFEDRRISYAELVRRSEIAARHLERVGVGVGDRVGMILPNCPAFVVWYFAILRVGGIAVSISTRLTAEEASFILGDCTCNVAIGLEQPDHVIHSLEKLSHRILVDEQGVNSEHDRSDERVPSIVDVEADAPAVILYTSGTTGFPKGATLSHLNVRATVHAFNHLCKMRSDDRLLLAVPLFHCYGQNALMNSGLNIGATIVLQRRFDLNESKRLIEQEHVTKLFGVPTTFQLLHDSCTLEDLKSIDYCFSAAATLPIQLSDRWRKKFRMPIYEGYGLTETAPFASYNHRLKFVPGSIGTPVDLVDMRVVDPETDAECPAGEPGEIVIRGPNVMLGYWNREEDTAIAIRNGWFHSGDIGYVDENGFFFIVDRLKDMISIGGMKVFPAEVERVLLDHPMVAEVAVVGFPDEVLGEQVVAFIVLAEGKTASEQEIKDYAAKSVASFKAPKRIVFTDALPRNPAGKVLKTELRKRELASEAPPQIVRGEDSTEVPGPHENHATVAPLVQQLLNVHSSQRTSEIVKILRKEVQSIAGTKELPDENEVLTEVGLDSLMIVELKDELQVLVGPQIELSATLFFDYPRIAELAQWLVETLDWSGQVQSPVSVEPNESQATAAQKPPATSADIEQLTEEEALEELLRELDD